GGARERTGREDESGVRRVHRHGISADVHRRVVRTRLAIATPEGRVVAVLSEPPFRPNFSHHVPGPDINRRGVDHRYGRIEIPDLRISAHPTDFPLNDKVRRTAVARSRTHGTVG